VTLIRTHALRSIATAALIGLLAPSAAAQSAEIAFVDGRKSKGLIVRADPEVAVIRTGSTESRVPTRHLVSAWTGRRAAAVSPDPFNIYLNGGDRLRGKVEGDGEKLAFQSDAIKGLTVPLYRATAVCLGTFFGQVQTNYRDLFFKQQAGGRDSIIVNRGSKPFSFRAAVQEIRKDALVVRMGDEQRELARDKVYGFTHTAAADAAQPTGVLVRVHLLDGGRITLPLKSITAETIHAGGASIARAQVARLEFVGDHIDHLSAMQPVAFDAVSLFGKAPRWRADGMVFGGPLKLGGRVYQRGIGVQAQARLEYAVGRRWGQLLLVCGIDDAASREGEATFRVIGDGKVLREVKHRRGEEPIVLRLDISGVDRLVLEALPGASYTSDLCDWAEARVFNDVGTLPDAERKQPDDK